MPDFPEMWEAMLQPTDASADLDEASN